MGSLCLDTLVVVERGEGADTGGLRIVESMLDAVGGCAGNTAVALSRMGARVHLAARIGEDLAGQWLSRRLRNVGIVQVTHAMAGPTGRTLVLVDSTTRDRSFLYAPGVNAETTLADLEGIHLSDFAAVVITDPFLTNLGQDGMIELANRARKCGVVVALALCWDWRDSWWNRLRDVLPLVHVVSGNGTEVARLTGESDPLRGGQALVRAGAGTALVTMGPAGLVAVTSEEACIEAAVSSTVVDTTGAGDWSSAAFLLGSVRGLPLRARAQAAALAGAVATEHLGGSTASASRALLTCLATAQRI